MVTYWIARAKIINNESYQKYASKAGDIVESYGGRFLTRGGDYNIMEGSDHFTRFVIAEFPDKQSAINCFESEEYKKAASNRRNGSGDVDIVFVESN